MAIPRPTTRYVAVGETEVAYQVIGEGPFDLVCAMGSWSNIALIWEYPRLTDFLVRLASFSRLVLIDHRGKGASGALPRDALPTWESWSEDLRAVLDAEQIPSAAILAEGEAGTLGILFAALHPERVQSLVLANTSARMLAADDYDIGISPAFADQCVQVVEHTWGTAASVQFGSPSRAADPEFVHEMSVVMQSSQTPRAAAAVTRYIMESIDVRHVLGLIQAPTLVLNNDNPLIPPTHGRFIADRIANAEFAQFPGNGTQLLWDPEVVDVAAEFLTGERPEVEVDRVLATVLFTDIVGSTPLAAELGDERWRDLLERHNKVVRDQLRRHRGREIDTTGDGFVAAFDGPARAIHCARAIHETTRELGVELRAGLHTGECVVSGDGLAGLAVHIAARVGALAKAGQVLVTRTVVELVAGSGLQFDDCGEFDLKGVADPWRLFTVVD